MVGSGGVYVSLWAGKDFDILVLSVISAAKRAVSGVGVGVVDRLGFLSLIFANKVANPL